MHNCGGELRWLVPAAVTVDDDMGAMGVALQVEQERFGGRHSAEAQYQVGLHALYKGVETEKGVVAHNDVALVVLAGAQWRERIGQDGIAGALSELDQRERQGGMVDWSGDDQAALGLLEQSGPVGS